MGSHSIADAKTHFSRLIDLVLDGEEVVITRHGKPVAELKPIPRPPRRITQEDIDWLDRHRVGTRPGPEDAGTLVSRMRDEDEER